jgi:hypothetical protein
MKFFPLVVGLLAAVMAFDLGRALVTHSGVGVVEWAVGLGLVAVLVAAAVTFARQSLRVS